MSLFSNKISNVQSIGEQNLQLQFTRLDLQKEDIDPPESNSKIEMVNSKKIENSDDEEQRVVKKSFFTEYKRDKGKKTYGLLWYDKKELALEEERKKRLERKITNFKIRLDDKYELKQVSRLDNSV